MINFHTKTKSIDGSNGTGNDNHAMTPNDIQGKEMVTRKMSAMEDSDSENTYYLATLTD